MKEFELVKKHNAICNKYNLIDYFIYEENELFYQYIFTGEKIYFSEYSEAPNTLDELNELIELKKEVYKNL